MLNLLVLIGLGTYGGLAAALVADRLSPGGDADYYVLPSPKMKSVIAIPQTAGNGKKMLAGRRKKTRIAETALLSASTFVEDDDDEKLSEIANFYNFESDHSLGGGRHG